MQITPSSHIMLCNYISNWQMFIFLYFSFSLFLLTPFLFLKLCARSHLCGHSLVPQYILNFLGKQWYLLDIVQTTCFRYFHFKIGLQSFFWWCHKLCKIGFLWLGKKKKHCSKITVRQEMSVVVTSLIPRFENFVVLNRDWIVMK